MDSVDRLIAKISKTTGTGSSAFTRYITAYSLANNVDCHYMQDSDYLLPYMYSQLKFDITYKSNEFNYIDIVVTNRFTMDAYVATIDTANYSRPVKIVSEDCLTNPQYMYAIYDDDNANKHSTLLVSLSMYDVMFGDVYILPYDDAAKKDEYFAPMIVPFTNTPTVLVSKIYKLHPETSTDAAQDYDNIFSANFGALSASICDSGRTNVLSGNAALYYNDVFSANRLMTNGLSSNDDTTKVSGHPIYCVDYSAFTPTALGHLYAVDGQRVKLVPTEMSAYLTSATDNFGAMTADRVTLAMSEVSSFSSYSLSMSNEYASVNGDMTIYRAFIYGDGEHDDEWYRTHTKLCADFRLSGVSEYWMDDTTVEMPIEIDYHARRYDIIDHQTDPDYQPPIAEFSFFYTGWGTRYYLLKKGTSADRHNRDNWVLIFDGSRPSAATILTPPLSEVPDPSVKVKIHDDVELDEDGLPILILEHTGLVRVDGDFKQGFIHTDTVNSCRYAFSDEDDKEHPQMFLVMARASSFTAELTIYRMSDMAYASEFDIRDADGEVAIMLCKSTGGSTPPTPPEPEPVPEGAVKIGDQIWMAKNLDVDDGLGGIAVVDGNYYYTQEAAIRVANSVDGWHLPTNAEFGALINAAGDNAGLKLKSTTGWDQDGNGTDEFGFNVLPVGAVYFVDAPTPQATSTSQEAYFRTSSTTSTSVISVKLAYNSTSMTRMYGPLNDEHLGHSVRLIKDA